MGQIASTVKGYLSPVNDENQCVIAEDKDFHDLKPVRNTYSLSSTCILSPSSALCTPRRPLKRSQRSSPIDASNELQNIFSPKRPKLDEQYLDFNFLTDSDLMHYINGSKVMFVLRGLPGSGKSTVAKTIQKKLESIIVCSADTFFMRDGVYEYEAEKIKDAHNQCQLNVIEAVRSEKNVVIDNTNIKNWELQFYYRLAKLYNYVILVIEPKTPWKEDVNVLAEKNKHGLDALKLDIKLNDFEYLKPPIYFGWFLNEKDSSYIYEVANNWLKEAFLLEGFTDSFKCYSGCDIFNNFEDFFKRSSASRLLHCTSKFMKCNGEDSVSYLEDKIVQNCIGKKFDLEVIGFILTPRTFGARLKLPEEALKLFAQDDEEEIPDSFWNLTCKEYDTENTYNGKECASTEETRMIDIPMESSNSEELFIPNSPELLSNAKENAVEMQVDGEDFHGKIVENNENGIESNAKENAIEMDGEDFHGKIVEKIDLMETEQTDSDHNAIKESWCGSQEEKTNEEISNFSLNEKESLLNAEEKISNGNVFTDVFNGNEAMFGNSEKIIYNGEQLNIDDPVLNKDTVTSIECPINYSDKKDSEKNCNVTNGKLNDSTGMDHLHDSAQEVINEFLNGEVLRKKKKKSTQTPIPPNDLLTEHTRTKLTCISVPQDRNNFHPTSGKGSRAHLTLYIENGGKAVITGQDLIFAIKNEDIACCSKNIQDDAKLNINEKLLEYSLDNGTLRGYGNGLWVIYPKEKIIVSSLFASYP